MRGGIFISDVAGRCVIGAAGLVWGGVVDKKPSRA